MVEDMKRYTRGFPLRLPTLQILNFVDGAISEIPSILMRGFIFVVETSVDVSLVNFGIEFGKRIYYIWLKTSGKISVRQKVTFYKRSEPSLNLLIFATVFLNDFILY